MARYIDADAVEKRIVDYYDAQLQSFPSSRGEEKRLLLGGINYGRNVVRDAPTADVAPRAEVAREIFDELKRYIINHCYLADDDVDAIWKHIDKLEKKYTEDSQ